MTRRSEQRQSLDGGWGWVIVLVSFLIHFLTDGIQYSFGIIYLELLEFYQSGKGETAWIGSLVPGITLFTGPLAGAMAKKFGCRITTIVGAIVASVGFILSAFPTNLYYLYFSFGILTGVGFGLTYLPAVVSANHYFDKKRTLAVGLASSGSGIGAFVFNPFSKLLIDRYGWRGYMLIMAGIILNCAVCGALLRPLSQPKSHDESSTSFLGEKESIPDMIQERGDFTLEPKKESLSLTSDGVQKKFDIVTKTNKEVRTPYKGMTTCLNTVAKSISTTIDLTLFKDLTFVVFLIANVLMSLGCNSPFMMLYDYAVDQNVDKDSAKWLGSITGISNTSGRVICGILADRGYFSKQTIFRATLILCGLATILCPLCYNFGLLVLYSIVFGLSFGIYIPLMSVVLVDLLGTERLNNSFGILLMFKGVSNILGPPVAGWLFDGTGSYVVSFLFSGLTIASSGLICYIPQLVQRCNKQTTSEINTAENKVQHL